MWDDCYAESPYRVAYGYDRGDENLWEWTSVHELVRFIHAEDRRNSGNMNRIEFRASYDCIEVGMGVIPNDRTVPFKVVDELGSTKIGTIRIEHRFKCLSPEGRTAYIERTSSGRVRLRYEGYNPPINITELRIRSEPRSRASHDR